MRLLIRQKVFSWRDRFYILDERGQNRYYAESEVFSWGKKLHVFDLSGHEVGYIEQKLWTWMPQYQICRNGTYVATICKEFTFFRPRYRVEGANWNVEGSFWAHDYQMVSNGQTVASVSKEWFTWGDCYTLDVQDGWDEVLALCVVLTIDCVAAQQAAAASST